MKLKELSEEVRSKRDVVLTAIRVNGLALQFASEELRGNREIVLEAVKTDGCALEFASTGPRL